MDNELRGILDELGELRAAVAALRARMDGAGIMDDGWRAPPVHIPGSDTGGVPLGKVDLLELVSSSSVRVRTAYVHLGSPSSSSPTGIALEFSPVVEDVVVGSSTLAQVRRRALVVSGSSSSSSLADIVDEQV